MRKNRWIRVHSLQKIQYFLLKAFLWRLTPFHHKFNLVLIFWKATVLTIIPPVLNPTHSLSENSHLNYPRCLSLLPKFWRLPFWTHIVSIVVFSFILAFTLILYYTIVNADADLYLYCRVCGLRFVFLLPPIKFLA